MLDTAFRGGGDLARPSFGVPPSTGDLERENAANGDDED